MNALLGCRLQVAGCRGKRGSILNEVIIHVILIALVTAIFLFAVSDRVNGRDVRQQVLEKQMALLIDSAEAGMNFEISKANVNGFVDSVGVQGDRIYIGVAGFRSVSGYPYFSRYSVEVEEEGDKFVVSIKK